MASTDSALRTVSATPLGRPSVVLWDGSSAIAGRLTSTVGTLIIERIQHALAATILAVPTARAEASGRHH